MSDDRFDRSACDTRHLTPSQWTALRKSIIVRAHEERNRAIRRMVMAAFAAVRNAWHRMRCRQQARAALRSMTDYELRDIGITRSGIEPAIRQNDLDAAGDRSAYCRPSCVACSTRSKRSSDRIASAS
jgi:uncharacterized protein YjiS (DUF1127 family)